MNASSSTTSPLIDAFLAWQQARHLSPKTIKRRRCSLGSFARWVAPGDVATATFTVVEEWLAQWPSPRTRHAYRTDLNVFYEWARKRGLVPHNPIDLVDPVKQPDSLPHPIPCELVPHVIATAPNPRLRLALALAAYAGLRRFEVCNLDRADIGPDTIVVRGGKGGKDRAVPISARLRPHLDDLPAYGRVVPITPDWLSAITTRHLASLGLEGSVHDARHSFGTEGYAAGIGLRDLAALMGHKRTSTTECYSLLNPDHTGIDLMYPEAA